MADTHTALWYLSNDLRISAAASGYIEDAANTRQKIAVSSISLAEVVYLVEKGRVPTHAYEYLMQAISNSEHVFTEAALTQDVVQAMRRVSRQEVPDMPDRIIVATAVYFGVPVISRDRRIRSAALQTVW